MPVDFSIFREPVVMSFGCNQYKDEYTHFILITPEITTSLQEEGRPSYFLKMHLLWLNTWLRVSAFKRELGVFHYCNSFL